MLKRSSCNDRLYFRLQVRYRVAAGPCASFNAATAPIPVIRSFVFEMASMGKVLVHFDDTT
jgi:hypothetical protein